MDRDSLTKRFRLSLVLPCYNEKDNISNTIRSCRGWMDKSGIEGEIIIVNDGSTDSTGKILDSLKSELKFKIVSFTVNQGYGAAVRAGCDEASEEFIAFMDSDGQFDPYDFNLLIPHLNQYDIVVGRRRKRADPFMRKLNAKLFGVLGWMVLGVWVRDVNCAMKIFRRSIWNKVRPSVSTGALFNAELFYNLKRSGINWKQIDVSHYPRLAGTQTGANISVILRMFKEVLKVKNDRG